MEEDKHLLIIDPSVHAAVLERCREAATVTVLLTHEHFDHISGLNRIRECCASSCRVIACATCSERIQDTKANLSAYADVLAELGGKQVIKEPDSERATNVESHQVTSAERRW